MGTATGDGRISSHFEAMVSKWKQRQQHTAANWAGPSSVQGGFCCISDHHQKLNREDCLEKKIAMFSTYFLSGKSCPG